MDLDGGNLYQLTHGSNDRFPESTPDGRWVYFSSRQSGTPALWKVAIEGGSPVEVKAGFGGNHSISPDGKWMARVTTAERMGRETMAFDIRNVDTWAVRPVPALKTWPGSFRWSPDGRALTYVVTDKGVSNVWTWPLDGSPPRQVTQFTSDRIFDFAWSRRGDLVVSRGDESSDAILIRNFRGNDAR
jgi:Tol biopolymer transport system component